MVKPAPEKYGCEASTPSSITPIFTPLPAVEKSAPQSRDAFTAARFDASLEP